MTFLLSILILAVAVFIVAKLMPSIHIKSFWTALVVALVYSVINFLVGWLLTLLALPFIILTLGLFKFVINAFLLWVTDKLIEDFEIDGVGATLIAALLITIIDWILTRLLLF